MNKYLELWAWTREVFGDKAFTMDQFRAVFPSPDPAKVLHDMARLNLIHRTEKAHYTLVQPTDLANNIIQENMGKETILQEATEPYAYSHDDAVTIWTDGYYWTGFTPGFKPVHIQVNKTHGKAWQAFFEANQAQHAFENQRKTLYGLVFILHPVTRIRRVVKDQTPVIPLQSVLEYCRERAHNYKPALNYLEEKYGPHTQQAEGHAT